MTVRHLSKTALSGAAVLLLAFVIAVLSLWCVRALPFAAAQNHIVEGAQQLSQEPSWYQLFPQTISTDLLNPFNGSDAIMLSVMMKDPGVSSFRSAVLDRLSGTEPTAARMIVLRAQGSQVTWWSYARYWHGYQIVLLPLLELFTYQQLKVFIGCVVAAELVAVAVLLIRKHRMIAEALLLVGAFLLSFGFMASASLQYATTYLIAFSALLVFLLFERRLSSRTTGFFFVIGILTAFFDILSTPLLTLGIPLLLVLILLRRRDLARKPGEGAGLKAYLGFLARSIGAWLSGYVIFWALKWALAVMAGDPGVTRGILQTGGQHLAIAGNQNLIVTMVQAIAYNLAVFIPRQLGQGVFLRCAIALVLIALVIGAWLLARNVRQISWDVARRELPLLLCALLPFVWFVLLPGHSKTSYWFSARILFISLWATALFIYYSLRRPAGHPGGPAAQLPES